MSSLRATYLLEPVLCAASLVNVDQLHKDILSALLLDPIATKHMSNISDPRWSVDSDGFLCLDNRIYIPDTNNLCLCLLHFKHDHPLAGHFRQNCTLELLCREYTWPGICSFVKEYVGSCTNCTQAKVPQHCPYGLLKQLPIPEHPWHSISMDFIEHLPSSSGYTSILVVVD